MPSEAFTAIEQLCHVRDIEIEGYHVRFRRTLQERTTTLASIDSEPLAIEHCVRHRRCGEGAGRIPPGTRADDGNHLLSLSDAQLARTAVFEGYGPLTMRSLIHYLCSHDQQHLAGLQWLAGKIDASTVDQ